MDVYILVSVCIFSKFYEYVNFRCHTRMTQSKYNYREPCFPFRFLQFKQILYKIYGFPNLFMTRFITFFNAFYPSGDIKKNVRFNDADKYI